MFFFSFFGIFSFARSNREFKEKEATILKVFKFSVKTLFHHLDELKQICYIECQKTNYRNHVDLYLSVVYVQLTDFWRSCGNLLGHVCVVLLAIVSGWFSALWLLNVICFFVKTEFLYYFRWYFCSTYLILSKPVWLIDILKKLFAEFYLLWKSQFVLLLYKCGVQGYVISYV